MKVTVQVVTRSDDGQESIREVASVECADLTPETLGLSLAEGKTILQAIQEVVVEWQMQAYVYLQRSQFELLNNPCVIYDGASPYSVEQKG